LDDLRGYGMLITMGSGHGWAQALGHSHIFAEDATSGIQFAGYRTYGSRCHIGGFLSISDNEQGLDGGEYALGFALKLGGAISDRVWLGWSLDIGPVFRKNFVGGHFFNGIALDVLVLGQKEGFKMAISGRLGNETVVMAFTDGDSNSDFDGLWRTRIVFNLGLSFGA